MNEFTQTDCLALHDNLFKLIGKDWMLVTAGDQKSYNTMTASWGGAGVLWNKNGVYFYPAPALYSSVYGSKRLLHPFVLSGRHAQRPVLLRSKIRPQRGQSKRNRAYPGF